jgi:hypothetical protein
MPYGQHRRILTIVALVLVLLPIAIVAARGRRISIDLNIWDEFLVELPLTQDEGGKEVLVPDSNSESISIPPIRVGDLEFTSVWINENGFLTLGGVGTVPTVFRNDLKSLEEIAGDVIAPYYADIDLRTPVHECYGGLLNSFPCDLSYARYPSQEDPDENTELPDYPRAFRITWGGFPEGAPEGGVTQSGGDPSERIRFQLLIVDRSNAQGARAGDFDLQFTYNGLSWEDAPLIAGLKIGDVLLNFGAFYDGDSYIDAGCAGPDVPDPFFDPGQPLACNSITVEFRNGVPNLRTYTSDISLSAAISADASTADTIPLSLTVRNSSFDTATNVASTVDLGADSTLESVEPSGASCAQTGTIVRCEHGELNTEDSATIVLNLSAGEAGTRAYSATANADQFDPNTENNTATASVTLAASADLVLETCTAPSSATRGSTLLLRCRVRNNGPQAAHALQLTTTLPSSISLGTGSGCSAAGTVLTCNRGELAMNDVADLDVTLNAVASGTASLDVSVSANEIDRVANNTMSISLTVDEPRSVSPPPPSPGGGGGALSILLLAAVGVLSQLRRVQIYADNRK